MGNKYTLKDISVVIPSYNNLEYLKLAYSSIRKSTKEVELIMFSDGSDDGTLEWLSNLNDKNVKIKIYKSRKGHTLLYDEGFKLSSNPIIGILHADMVVHQNFFKSILSNIKPNSVVCGTCVEPPLHPPGGEKHIFDAGMYPNEFNEKLFNNFCSGRDLNKTLESIFAPWFILKDDYFSKIGKHDIMYAPYGYEDSDLFTRMSLANLSFIQSRDAFVYHFTQRGHKWTKGVGIENDDYKYQMGKTQKEYIRKFGSLPSFNQNHTPTPTPKYDIGFKIINCSLNLLEALEPWCSTILIDDEMGVITSHYLDKEQPNTIINLTEKIKSTPFDVLENEIVVEINAASFHQQDFKTIQQLSEIIKDSGEIGEFELGNLKITIKEMNEYQNDLIKL